MRIVVAVSQRVDEHPTRGERRDALDQAWAPLLEAVGVDLLLVPNRLSEPAAFARRMGVAALLLTGGNDLSPALKRLDGSPAGGLPVEGTCPERDRSESDLLVTATAEGWPVVAVCRGMQALNAFHGGGLSRVDGHVATRHPLSAVSETGIARVEVNSFHDYAVTDETLAPGFRVLARHGDAIEAMLHQRLPQLGIMWHPERETTPFPGDVSLLSSFLRSGRLNS